MGRFEVVFYPGEDEERLPEWRVIELEDVSPTMRVGKTVWRSYDMYRGEESAREMAYSFYKEYA